VTPVVIGGRHRRRQPDAVHSQPRQVVEPRDHPPQIAEPVPVTVPPGADVDLVQGGPAPPLRASRARVHVPPTGCGPATVPARRPGRWRLSTEPYPAAGLLLAALTTETGPVSPPFQLLVATALPIAAIYSLIGGGRLVRWISEQGSRPLPPEPVGKIQA